MDDFLENARNGDDWLGWRASDPPAPARREDRAVDATHSADTFTPGRLSPIILAMKASIEIGKK